MATSVKTSSWPSFLPERELLLATGAERREAGSLHFSEALHVLLRHVSHPQLSELADWACHEAGNLHTSQISHMRNNKVRMLGTKSIDALGRLNQLAWVARHQSDLLPQLGCAPMTPRIQGLLKAYQPLVHPLTQAPLGAGEFMALYLGYLRLPMTVPRGLSSEEAERIAGVLGDWLEERLAAKGLSFREASKRLQQLWSGEGAGGKRLVRVLAGLEDYTPKQLTAEWDTIALAVLTLLDEPVDPWELAETLLALEAKKGATKGPGMSPSESTSEGKGQGAAKSTSTGPAPTAKASRRQTPAATTPIRKRSTRKPATKA